MNKCVVIIMLLFFTHLSYGQRYDFKPKYSTILDTANGRKSLKQCSRPGPKDVSSIFVVTTAQEVSLEKNFKKVLDLTDTSFVLRKSKHLKWPKVKRLDSLLYQYTGVIINGKKYIYISAFSYGSGDWQSTNFYENWKTEAIRICDGGFSFWGVLFDMRRKSFSQLRFNGQ